MISLKRENWHNDSVGFDAPRDCDFSMTEITDRHRLFGSDVWRIPGGIQLLLTGFDDIDFFNHEIVRFQRILSSHGNISMFFVGDI